MFWTDEDLGSDIYLDGIITVVDARNVSKNLISAGPFQKETIQQIAFADRVLLNKCDLVTDSKLLSHLEHELKQVNQFAPIKRCENAQ
jgi:G3E family GTPase